MSSVRDGSYLISFLLLVNGIGISLISILFFGLILLYNNAGGK